MKENGNISVHTENIFPIIKKWLYSDKDIFLREIVSNACDAISKMKKVRAAGEAEKSDEGYMVRIVLDKKKGTIVVSDNGIGMTDEEVRKYINQVAFSSAEEFIEKYKEKEDEKSQIIGHFGLGFYSSFMVSDKVEIDTLSYKDGEKPVKWECEGGTEYEISDGEKAEHGTRITMHIAKDSKEFLEYAKLNDILKKYCAFLPYEIFLEDVADKKDDLKPVNDTNPLWTKKPKDCTGEEYIAFYHKVFFDFNPPLFWIHLNVDYPFRLQGILYFPKLKHEFETMEGQIKLFNNQVFVADNIKEVVPEFMLLLKGVIDCPDLPLNVSRSFLQNDGYVQKVSQHITKKVADKLSDLFKKQRDDYNKYWDDINPFVKYGCLRDEKFYEKVKPSIIFKTINNEYISLNELLEQKSEKVFYASDERQQTQYINIFKEHNIPALMLPHMIDNHFVSFLEMKEKDLKFARIDSDISEAMKKDEEIGGKDEILSLFKDSLGNENLKIEVQNLKTSAMPAMILLSEQSRRFQEMSRTFGQSGMMGMYPDEHTLVINSANPLVEKLLKITEKADAKIICEHIYDLAMMSHKPLEAEAMTKFIQRSNEILTKIAQ